MKRASGGQDEGRTSSAAWPAAVLATAALAMGLVLVWLNIERMDLAYEIRKLEKDHSRLQTLIAKLEVERENLMSPQRLRRIAGEMGLGPAEAGQIRRVRTSGAPYEARNGTEGTSTKNGTAMP